MWMIKSLTYKKKGRRPGFSTRRKTKTSQVSTQTRSQDSTPQKSKGSLICLNFGPEVLLWLFIFVWSSAPTNIVVTCHPHYYMGEKLHNYYCTHYHFTDLFFPAYFSFMCSHDRLRRPHGIILQDHESHQGKMKGS